MMVDNNRVLHDRVWILSRAGNDRQRQWWRSRTSSSSIVSRAHWLKYSASLVNIHNGCVAAKIIRKLCFSWDPGCQVCLWKGAPSVAHRRPHPSWFLPFGPRNRGGDRTRGNPLLMPGLTWLLDSGRWEGRQEFPGLSFIFFRNWMYLCDLLSTLSPSLSSSLSGGGGVTLDALKSLL